MKLLLAIAPLFWPKMPPIGIGYLQAFLEKNNIECGIIDLNNIFYNLSPAELRKSWLVSCNLPLEEKIFDIIQKNHPGEFKNILDKMLGYDIIGFSCFKSNLSASLKLISLLKSKNKNIKIILGGPEMTRQYFKTSGNFTENILGVSDFIVVGEGEKSLLNYITLIQRYHKSRAGLNLPYFCSFKELNNLNTLPFPSYRGIDIKSYPRKNSVPILFSRGCIRKCRFCSERLLYKKFRARPVENVIEEIRRQTIINKIEYFIFHDSLINGDLGKLEKLCDSIIKNFGSIKWEAQIAVRSDMSASLLKKMKKSGCYNLFIGLESGCARTLKDMNKGFTPKDALRFFKKLNNASLFFGISIITGYPGETEADFIESMDFIIKNKPLIPKIEQVNPFTYYDGTSAGRIAEKDSAKRHGILTDKIKSHGFRYTNAFLGNLIEK